MRYGVRPWAMSLQHSSEQPAVATSPCGAFTALRPIILASGSPRRQEMLANLGLRFDIRPAQGDEPDPDPGEEPSAYAVRAALAKAREVAAGAGPDAVILAADTIVVSPRGEILGKPRDAVHARDMLAGLAGRSQTVITGCAIVADGLERTLAGLTRVDMAPAGPEAIAAYVATGEPMDKAGSFAIQGQGAFLVAGIEGSFSNVVGLPVAEVLAVLLELGAVAPREAS